MKNILDTLYDGKRLDREQSYILFRAITQNKLSSEQLSAVLISMKIRGESIDEIIGAVNFFLEHAQPFPRPSYLFADIVGTGVGRHIYKNINISTASAIVSATCGVPIAKHGNRNVTSNHYGSADIVESFGIRLNMSSNESRSALDRLGICFLFAQEYHSCFLHSLLVRKKLVTKTIFNIVGTLINPAKPPLILIGVYHPRLIPILAETVKILGYKRAIIVHSGGIDEVTLHTITKVAECKDGVIQYYTLNPEDFGLPFQTYSSIYSKSRVEKNHHILMKQLLQGTVQNTYKHVVAANVAIVLKLFGHDDLRENTYRALDEINSGSPYSRIISFYEQTKIRENKQ